jgi:hypothetical protein
MKLPAERLYWIAVGFVLFFAAAYLATLAWQTFVGRTDGEAVDLFFLLASWLFPLAVGPAVMVAEVAVPQLRSSGIDAVALVHVLLTIGMAVWFYCSRQAQLRLRVAVLTGLMAFGVVARLIVLLLILRWAYS